MKAFLLRVIVVMFLLLQFMMAQGQQNEFGNTIKVAAEVRGKDKDGKITYADWKDFQTLLVDSLKNFKQISAPLLDKYGGDATKTLAGKGFFSVVNKDGRWWCVTPEGHAYINMAVNSINRGGSERNTKAFDEKFGSEKVWMAFTTSLLRDAGFNSGGSWSDTKAIVAANSSANKPLAYCINWNFMSQYGRQRGGTFQVPGHTGYPGNVIFVFDPAFPPFCDSLAKQVSQYKNDKALFGYFSDNEMPFNIGNLEGYLSLPENDFGYIAAKKWLDEKRIIKEQLTEQDKKDFLAYEAEKYFAIVSKSIKKYDPNHLYLGCRFYSGEKNIPEFMKAAGKYLDIISINYYGAWTPSQTSMDNWAEWSGKPFIITEYYTKGEDSGLPNISGAGWIVKTQEDRGKFYQNFCLGLLQSKACVGWHWFKYQDNDPTQKATDPSNNDANKGIVDNNYKPYEPLLAKMKQLNVNSYALINYFDKKNMVSSPLDLYLLIGQSNMAGRGIITDEYINEGAVNVMMLDKENHWVPAKHPLHFDKPTVAGIGPGLSFGIEMAKQAPSHKIGLVPCAVGGTSINTWKPGAYDDATKTHPYDDMLLRIKAAQKRGVFKGVLWLQGESDSDPAKSVGYLQKLETLISELRAAIGDPSLPFVAGEIGKFKEQYGNINKQLSDLPRIVPHSAVATSENLKDKGDQTHFDAASAEEYGKRFAEKMKELLRLSRK
ncbi:MAG: hypothetical protein M3Y85_10085 [Bacteroidota bacterium]|nr:hypothetical protein [Bacteroidota bacterium]